MAHEWGTFTSVQGADGVQLEWNPLSVSELPGFVHGTRQRPTAGLPPALGKTAFSTLRRMETPVIYFYSDKELSVDATVDFPQGIVTEWFPQATQALPARGAAPARASRSPSSAGKTCRCCRRHDTAPSPDCCRQTTRGAKPAFSSSRPLAAR